MAGTQLWPTGTSIATIKKGEVRLPKCQCHSPDIWADVPSSLPSTTSVTTTVTTTTTTLSSAFTTPMVVFPALQPAVLNRNPSQSSDSSQQEGMTGGSGGDSVPGTPSDWVPVTRARSKRKGMLSSPPHIEDDVKPPPNIRTPSGSTGMSAGSGSGHTPPGKPSQCRASVCGVCGGLKPQYHHVLSIILKAAPLARPTIAELLKVSQNNSCTTIVSPVFTTCCGLLFQRSFFLHNRLVTLDDNTVDVRAMAWTMSHTYFVL